MKFTNMAIMEAKWMSGFTKDIAANYLASSTSVFSEELIRRLLADLEPNREQLARELSLAEGRAFSVEFSQWCNSPGSTVFVLVAVLNNLGRTDCVQRIEQYMQMHTMQLFVKVEEAPIDGQLYVTSPKFHQVTTSCEFSLVQALENFLGGDLAHYEIVGPGPWVKWSTLAKELKGQQLTLQYHEKPLPDTRAAIYGTTESETQLKQPAVTHNIPVSMDTGGDTHLKALEYTQIEDLKYVPDSSIQASNSDNLMLSGSLECDKRNLQSILAEGPTSALSFPSLESQNYQFTLDSQTQAKVPMAGKNNTPEYVQVKLFPDKQLFEDSTSKRGNHESLSNPLEILNNVPHFSLLEPSLSVVSSNSHVLQTATKSPLPITINHSFEDHSKSQPTHKPNLPSAHNQSLHTDNEKKQNNLNNLNCVTISSCPASLFVKNSLDSKIIPKTVSLDAAPSLTAVRTESPLSHEENSQDCAVNVENHWSKIVEGNVKTTEIGSSNSLLISQGQSQQREIQQLNISMCSPDMEYIPHSSFQTLGGQFQNTVSTEAPIQCNKQMKTSPQKRYRFGHPTSSDSPQEQEMHHQLQLQALLAAKSWEQKESESKQLQRSELDFPQNTKSVRENFPSTVSLGYHLWQQKLQDHDHAVSESGLQKLKASYFQQIPCEQDQRWSQESLENEHQIQYLSHHQFQYQQQLKQQPEIHSLDQPFLICHTPPPSFPDEARQENYPVSEVKQRPRAQTEQFISSLSYRSSPSAQFKVYPMNNTNGYMAMLHKTSTDIGSTSNRSSPVMSRCETPVDQSKSTVLPNFEFVVRLPHPDFNAISSDSQILRTHSRVALGSSNSSSLGAGSTFSHNRQFSMAQSEQETFCHNRQFSMAQSEQQTFSQNPQFSLAQSEQETFSHSQQFSMAQSEQKSPLMIPRPFNPAPPNMHSFRSQARSSVGNVGDENISGIISTDEEGYNYIDNGHLSRSKSLPVSRWHSPATPRRAGVSLDKELLCLEGWCPLENGDTIQNTMEKYRSQDGSFIIWKSRRHNKFVISVSHLNQIFHFLVEEIRPENRNTLVYYLFEGGFRSESLLDLIQHYRQNGVRITMQSPNGMKTHIEHIQLRYPVRVKQKEK